ncbi:unnamed protein product [Paramecium primaurelia]|uniref:Uncharacterized protein n=1 Tax=Paramecium primaurelia TaxID=5886 RepID=A0A8S1MCG3_PARPR|nr:unnamed protein product [Paramecium primaurelia]CAD8075373.1 unnamed protein product [Paramecium primaurelia]CAD8075375.1 unnamed protein product [Paramecium primaurelia]CAD8075377.1 unnamed protein product [Paramecium primaurelia]
MQQLLYQHSLVITIIIGLDSIKAFVIFKNDWIIADLKYVYQMSKNAQKLINKLEIQETQYIYTTSDKIIIQTKEGWIHIINEEFSKQNLFHLNIFSFCRLCIHQDLLFSINSNQLETRNINSLDIEFYEYQSEIFCTSIKVINSEIDQFIIIVLDNGIIDVLKNKTQIHKYQLSQNKQNPIFVYDCIPIIQNKELLIAVSTNQQSIIILKNQVQQQTVNLSFSPTTIFSYSKTELSPLIAFNKNRFALITNKEICKFNFTDITNYYFQKYCYLSTNEQIIIIDFDYLKQ